MIEFKDVSKVYANGTVALENINLTIEDGEFVFIVGASGAGKTTLMNIIGCMDRFNEGSYSISGIPVAHLEDEQLTLLRNRLIGFIFQRYHLLPKYTVLQNVMLPLLVRVPVTSKGLFLKYTARLTSTLTPLNGVVTRISLKKATSRGGKPYALFHFEAVSALSPEEAASAKAFARQFMEAVKASEAMPKLEAAG